MKIKPKVRNAVLVAALAAVTATAWATNEALTDSTYAYAPANTVATEEMASESLAVSDTLSPSETVVIVPVAAPVIEPGIVVQERRMTADERIQAQVMDTLATSNISGKIGVESNNSVVTLSGWTTTAMQADRASRYARGVVGVKYVENQIRPRIGGSAS